MLGNTHMGIPMTGSPQAGPQARPTREPQGDGGDARTGKPKWEMPRWANVTLTTSTVILTLLATFLGGKYLLNMRFVDSYANGSYNAAIPNTLTYLNFPDPYLPYYNFGCATFMMGSYDYAAGAFLEALENEPPHDEPYPSKECQVRINLALALTRPLDVKHWKTESERQALIRILTEARGYLTEDGCANPAKDVFDGHSEDAEQLKKDIDRALEKLSDPNGGGDDGDDDSEDQQDQDGQEDQDDSQGGQGDQQSEDRLKERLNNRKTDAMEERTQEQQQWGDLSSLGNGGSEGGDGQGGGPSGKTW